MENPYKLCTVKQIGDQQGIIKFRLTERMVDRDSEVIEPAGIKLDNYSKNPQFLWSHDIWGDNLPIGKTLMDTVIQKKEFLDATVMFDLEDEFAAKVYKKYLGGFLTSGSIRFIPKAWDRDPVFPDQKGLTITKSELLEFSAVIVPANPGAIVLEKDFYPKDSHLLQVMEKFNIARNYDHNPKGWVDFLNKKNGDLDVNENNRVIFDFKNGLNFEVAASAKEIKFSDGSVLTFDKLDEFKKGGFELTVADDQEELDDFEEPNQDSAAEEQAIMFNEKIYSLEEWAEVAQAMNDLIDADLPKEQKQKFYEILVASYKKFEKEPPEFNAIVGSSKSEDGQEPETNDEKDITIDDILDELIKDTNKEPGDNE